MGLAATLPESDLADSRIAARPPMPHIPALDGVRAIAVAAVLLYHAEVPWLPGGFLGVEVFFTVSGYLITALLLAEVERSGGVDLRAFWVRRARRLLPALAFYLVGSLALAITLAPDVVDDWLSGSWAATFYVANWYAVANEVSYTDAFGRPSFLHHLWSLAVEEQFYILWPIALAAGLRWFGRRLSFVLIVAGIAASTMTMWLLYTPLEDPLRVYYGTDTRASGLLVGAALAFTWRPWEFPATTPTIARRRFRVGTALSLTGSLWLLRSFSIYDLSPIEADPVFRGGFLITAVATTALLAGLTVADTPISKLFAIPALRWMGTRSYAIYLWHWPIYQVTRPRIDVDVDGPLLFAIRILATFVAAEVSYRLVEIPYRRSDRPTFAVRSRFATLRRALPAIVGGAAMIVSFAVLVELQRADDPGVAATAEITNRRLVVVDGAVVEDVTAVADDDQADDGTDLDDEGGSDDDLSEVDGEPIVRGPSEETTEETTEGTPSTPVPDTSGQGAATIKPTRVTLVGDSVMAGAGGELGRLGRNVVLDAAVGRQWWDLEAVLRRIEADAGFGDAVVLHLGNNGPVSEDMFDDAVRRLRRVDRVVIVNVRAPVRWERPVNRALRGGVARWENMVLVDWNELSAPHPEYFTEDGVHLELAGQRAYFRAIRDALAS